MRKTWHKPHPELGRLSLEPLNTHLDTLSSLNGPSWKSPSTDIHIQQDKKDTQGLDFLVALVPQMMQYKTNNLPHCGKKFL